MGTKLSGRAVKAIRGALAKRGVPRRGTATPALVARLSTLDLLREPNCGRRTLFEIEAWLRENGFEPRLHRDESISAPHELDRQIEQINQKIRELEEERERLLSLRRQLF
jgi:hypothetical protein